MNQETNNNANVQKTTRERTPVAERIQNYIVSAIEAGFDGKDTLTRADCLAIREATGEKLPRWLMKDDARRIGRGTYSFPELKAATDAVESNEDAEAEAIADRILDSAAINADETVSV
tara:strand:- start:289 stop:642 length:354 start_codon:yes stop_codon:yes gene_type:complete